MQSRIFGFLVFWIFVSLLLDVYIYTTLRSIYPSGSASRKVVLGVYGIFALFNIGLLISAMFYNPMEMNKDLRTWMMMIFLLFLLFKIIFTFFIFIDDVMRLVRWISAKFFSNAPADQASFSISRYKFLILVGGAIAMIPSISLLYGALFNAYNYRFRRKNIAFSNLPSAFHGMKVIQISDIHSGSFTQTQPIIDVIQKINAENADLILFTGDIVNNTADELEPYLDIFSQLKAKHGVVSVVGNHDYGDYWEWKSKDDKVANFQQLVQHHASMGWKLLLNENITLDRDGEQISIIGVENWSANHRFRTKGDLPKAKLGTEASPFKILMSHDPSHWDAEVLQSHPDIDLTLSGHTHGFQFGIEIPGFLKWSPSQYAYKQWADLYQTGKQYLYVNRGFGFLGYPGRVGILPEISVFTLERA